MSIKLAAIIMFVLLLIVTVIFGIMSYKEKDDKTIYRFLVLASISIAIISFLLRVATMAS